MLSQEQAAELRAARLAGRDEGRRVAAENILSYQRCEPTCTYSLTPASPPPQRHAPGTPETIAGAARALITNAWCLASPWMPAIPCPLRSTRPPPPRPHRPRARLPWPHHRTELASARATSLQGRFVWLGLLLLPNGTCAFSTISPVAKSRISRCARHS